jgi:hypothetical protein
MLNFSENFHLGWKLYSGSTKEWKSNDLNPNYYKMLDGNSDFQADLGELSMYIENKWVSGLGLLSDKVVNHQKWEDGDKKLNYDEWYKYDFISKKINNSIQNDNLPNGKLWETWFTKSSMIEKNHQISNLFTNEWIVNPGEVCFKTNDCIKNDNGGYDFELTLEFWPQRVYFIGLSISLITLILCLLYSWVDFLKHRHRVL